MDLLAVELEKAKKRLTEQAIHFSIEYTHPYTRSSADKQSDWYVIRQHQKQDGSFGLLAAAKMGKEVF